jgi:hypothetical protein
MVAMDIDEQENPHAFRANVDAYELAKAARRAEKTRGEL